MCLQFTHLNEEACQHHDSIGKASSDICEK